MTKRTLLLNRLTKSSHLGEFRLIMRQLDFHEFRGDERRVEPENDIFRKIMKNVKYLKNVDLR